MRGPGSLRRYRAGRGGSLAALLLLAAGSAGAAKLKLPSPEEITNLFLSPKHSTWLVGALSQIATRDETAAYLALGTDEEAEQYIREFWERRGGSTVFPKKSLWVRFEERAEEADRKFSELTYSGRRTDRGTVYILYGPPKTTDYATAPRPRNVTIEVWTYGKDAEEGLDGRKPERVYRFAKESDLTTFYVGPVPRRSLTAPGRRRD